MERVPNEDLGGNSPNNEEIAFGNGKFNLRPLRNKDKEFFNEEDIQKDWGWLDEMISDLPDRSSGINCERAENFARSVGMIMPKVKIIDRKDYQLLREKVGIDAEAYGFTDDVLGTYLFAIDTILIVRQEDEEQIDPNLEVEHSIVHETAHANSVFGFMPITKKIDDKDIKLRGLSRIGMISIDLKNNTKRGFFLEEAFAELIAEQYSSAVDHNFFTNKSLHASQPAAEGLRLMIDQRPELLYAMLKSRQDPAELETVAKIINDIKPGLYDILQKITYTKEDFEEGLKEIKTTLN